jgi:hypothetical protein
VCAGIIAPITVHDLVPDGETMSQAQRRQAERPKVVRIRSRSEYRPEDSPDKTHMFSAASSDRTTRSRRIGLF